MELMGATEATGTIMASTEDLHQTNSRRIRMHLISLILGATFKVQSKASTRLLVSLMASHRWPNSVNSPSNCKRLFFDYYI
jgi:hypothetical protein